MAKHSKFDLDLKWGQEGEEWLKVLADERTLEVKRDKMWHETGNVFFEVACSGKPSGIMITEADYFCYVLTKDKQQQACFIWRTELLKKALAAFTGGKKTRGGDRYAVEGILVKVEDLGKLVGI